jgi:hypothetical protein
MFKFRTWKTVLPVAFGGAVYVATKGNIPATTMIAFLTAFVITVCGI